MAATPPGFMTQVSGWGRHPVVNTYLNRPEKIGQLAGLIDSAQEWTVLPRGMGRSYGDASLNPDGCTVLTERLDRLLQFDGASGTLLCEAGVTLEEILEIFVPRGWFPSVTPGTKFVSVGGLVACDVHGKNHHQDGSFSRCVKKLRIALASGDIVECGPDLHSDLYWATVAGMGLTGIVSEVEMTLRPVSTAYIELHTVKSKNLDDTMALLDELESGYQYSVAWIDCLASGANLGRSILMLGNHAAVADLSADRREQPLRWKNKKRLTVPCDMPAGLLNRFTMSAFNTLYYQRHLPRETHSIVDCDSFFYPLDSILEWNRLYGQKGFIQYQCVFPPEESLKGLVEVLTLCSSRGRGSFLAVLKRFGPQEGLLSFPMPGYTLTLDMPVRDGLWAFLDELDRIVLTHGGRVYLAKDARLSPETFRQMYPDFPRWLAIKSAVDPDNVFSSALSARLRMGEP